MFDKEAWIIRVIRIVLMLVVMVSVVGCQSVNDIGDFVASSVRDEKSRIVFLYGDNGNLIDTWDDIFVVSKVGDTVSLTGSNGSLYITGGIVVIEEN